jgi:hypothetical protein
MQKDSAIAAMYAEAVRLAHHTLNRNNSKLVDDSVVHGLANALIAGGHVQPGSGSGKGSGIDRAGVDSRQDGLLNKSYGDES